MQQRSEVRAGRLLVVGFAGDTAPDHIDHLHGMPEFLRQLDALAQKQADNGPVERRVHPARDAAVNRNRAMNPDLREVVASFDRRASGYERSGWHRDCAARLVALCDLRPGWRVLDAATGTGFVAIAAARAVGPEGSVVGVDISRGMLGQARNALRAERINNVHLVEGNAVHLPQYASGRFDAITCGTGLLYMPVADALREWHRLLKPRGLLGFSALLAGSPPAAEIFRQCAARFGLELRDPWEELGSPSACRARVEEAGFEVTAIAAETVQFSAVDLANAWESNSQSASHPEVRRLSAEEQQALKAAYFEALAQADAASPGCLTRAGGLYAIARRGV